MGGLGGLSGLNAMPAPLERAPAPYVAVEPAAQQVSKPSDLMVPKANVRCWPQGLEHAAAAGWQLPSVGTDTDLLLRRNT
jgi:hypothetical protein